MLLKSQIVLRGGGEARASLPPRRKSKERRSLERNSESCSQGNGRTLEAAALPTPSHPEFSAAKEEDMQEDEDDGNEELAGYLDERSVKRTRSTRSRGTTGDRSTSSHRSYPSTRDGYQWELISDSRRDRLNQALDSNREERPTRSFGDLHITDREPVIKQEPSEFPMNLPASSRSISLTSAQSISPSRSPPPTGSVVAHSLTSKALTKAIENVDLYRLCIPCMGPNETPVSVSRDEVRLLHDMQTRAMRILRGEKNKVDIRSRLPAWMRKGLSKGQSRGITMIQMRIKEMQRKIKASQSVSKGGRVGAKGTKATLAGSKPGPIKHTPGSVPLPLGLEPLDYDNLVGPALVYSALEQVNNMLEMFEANVRCLLSGLDSINLQKSTGQVQTPPPPSWLPLSLANQPYTELLGPSLAHHALQEINEMMRSFRLPQQFALCWRDLQKMQQ